MMMLKRTALYAAFLVVATSVAIQDAVVLRRELKPETSEVYEMTTKLDQIVQAPTGEIPVGLTTKAKITFKIGKVDPEKGAEITMVTSDMDMKIDSPMAGMMGDPAASMPKEVVSSATMDARNRISGMKMQGANAQMAMMGASSLQSFGTFIEFPEKAVKIGDSWDVIMPKNPMTGNQEAKFVAKLVGQKVHAEKPVWVLTLDGTMPMKLDMGEMLKNNPEATGGMPVQNMMITGTTKMSSQALVDKATGKTLLMETKMDSNQKVEISDFGMTMDVSGKGTVKFELK